MQQLVVDLLVGADGEGQPALGSGDSSGSFQEGSAQGLRRGEAPEGASLPGGGALRWLADHLQLAAEVVGRHGSGEIELVADQRAGGHVIELGLGLELGEHTLLGAPSVVQAHRVAGGLGLVGQHHGELVVPGDGLEEIELDRAFRAWRWRVRSTSRRKRRGQLLGFQRSSK